MSQAVYTRRIHITGLIVLGIACFFVYRLASLHFSTRVAIPPNSAPDIQRGCIRDRNGRVLAVSIERESLFANQREIENPDEAAAVLAPVLGSSREQLAERLRGDRQFVWIKRKLDDETASRVRSMNMRGLYMKKEYLRAYPHGRLASNIVGFAGMDNNGLEGIEYKFDGRLSGISDGGAAASDDTVKGYSINLTIDGLIQSVAEHEIEEGSRRYSAIRGAAVVYEIKTGRILALAKYPAFNPNEYWKYSPEERRNFTVVDSFEPGSTLKIIAAAALLQNNPDVLRESFTCRGSIDIADTTVKCTGVHGALGLDGIIKHSCNAGIIQAMKREKKDSYYATLRRFGFGQITEVEIPGESEGLLRPVNEWSGLSKYSMSLGQEISVTSLQLIAAFGAIANRGVYMTPSIIESIERQDGSRLQEFYPRSKGRIIREDIALRLMHMLRGVVEGGTGERASIARYDVAGKTGTAQKSMNKGGYYPDKVMASYIGVAPFRDPEICILVVIDEPGIPASGGDAAAPVFAKIAGRVLPYLGIKTSHIAARQPLRSRIPAPPADYTRMPDFRGRSLSEAMMMLTRLQKKANIAYTLSGKGTVFRQMPGPGEALRNPQAITLFLREQ